MLVHYSYPQHQVQQPRVITRLCPCIGNPQPEMGKLGNVTTTAQGKCWGSQYPVRKKAGQGKMSRKNIPVTKVRQKQLPDTIRMFQEGSLLYQKSPELPASITQRRTVMVTQGAGEESLLFSEQKYQIHHSLRTDPCSVGPFLVGPRWGFVQTSQQMSLECLQPQLEERQHNNKVILCTYPSETPAPAARC